MKLKKTLSPWTYLMYHITKLILYKIAASNNRFQIVMVWLSLFYGFIDQDFLAFKVIISLWCFITMLRTIEYLEPNWIP